MEPTTTTAIVSSLLAAVFALILLIVNNTISKTGKLQEKNTLAQEKNTLIQKEQTKAFNKLLTSSEVANANYKNFVSNCAATTTHVTKRLDSHAKDLKGLNKKQGEQDTRLREHDRRLDVVERGSNG